MRSEKSVCPILPWKTGGNVIREGTGKGQRGKEWGDLCMSVKKG